eukprot:jgi/Picre1/33352/NNA_008676.t1
MSDNNNNEDALKSDEIYPCRRGKILRNVKGVIEYKGGITGKPTHLKRQRVNHASSQVEYVEPTNPTWVYKYRQLTREEILHAQMVLKNRKRLRGLDGDEVPVLATDEHGGYDFDMDEYGASPCPSGATETTREEHMNGSQVPSSMIIREDDRIDQTDSISPLVRVKEDLADLMQHPVPRKYFIQALGAWIKNTTPMSHINEELERMQPWNQLFNVPVVPDHRKMRKMLRILHPGYQKRFTCREHHESSRATKEPHDTCDYGSCRLARNICIRYCSVKDAIRRLLQNSQFRTEVQLSARNSRQSSTRCTDIWSAKFVKDMRRKYPSFFTTSDGYTPLLFGLFVDGFRVSQASYTAGAVVLVCFNLPADIRMDSKNLQLLQLIDGPTEPNAEGWQRYLGQIVDEFHHLMNGFVLDGEKYRAALICTMQDGRATKKTSMLDEAGAKDACIKCTVQREENTGSSQCYFSKGNLEPGDSLRGEFAPVWIEKDHDFIRARRSMDPALRNEFPGLASGVIGESVFERLPYWDSSRCHLLCFMHTMKNFGSHLEKLVEGEKENPATRKLLFKKGFLNMESHLHLSVHQDSKGKDKLPRSHPPWTFNTDIDCPLNNTTAIKVLKNVSTPSRLCIQPSRLFRKTQQADNEIEGPITRQKDIGVKNTGESAPMKQFLLSGLFSYVLYIGGVDRDLVKALDKLLSLLNRLLAPAVDLTRVDALGRDIWRALVALENHLPHHCLPLCVHNIGHLSRQVKDFGPISGYHSYPLESYLGDLKGMNLNPAHPTATIFERIMRDYSMETLIGLLSEDEAQASLVPKFQDDILLHEPISRVQMANISTSEMHLIKRYIESKWEEYKKLQCQSRHFCLWTFGDRMSAAERVKYSGRQRKILEGIRGDVTRYKGFQINQTRFSIKDGLKSEDGTHEANITTGAFEYQN